MVRIKYLLTSGLKWYVSSAQLSRTIKYKMYHFPRRKKLHFERVQQFLLRLRGFSSDDQLIILKVYSIKTFVIQTILFCALFLFIQKYELESCYSSFLMFLYLFIYEFNYSSIHLLFVHFSPLSTKHYTSLMNSASSSNISSFLSLLVSCRAKNVLGLKSSGSSLSVSSQTSCICALLPCELNKNNYNHE